MAGTAKSPSRHGHYFRCRWWQSYLDQKERISWLDIFSWGTGFFLLCTFPTVAWAGAFRVFDHSASGTAQGGAFAAQADDASAIYFNPAGMTQLSGMQVSVGTLLLAGGTTFASPSGSRTSGDFGGILAFPPPSNFYITANLKDLGMTGLRNLSAGIGVISPFGVMYRYPGDAPFSTAVTSQTLPLLDVKPTIAYRFNDQMALGIGADIYTFASFWGPGRAVTKFNSSGGPGLPPAGTPLEVNGNDTAVGFNVSLLYTPLRNGNGQPLLNLGLLYRSQATLNLDGHFLVAGTRVADASTTLVLPQVITAGIAFWPIRNDEREWKLELDIDHTAWKSLRNLDVSLSSGTTIPLPQNWRSGYTVMVGTEYKWLNPQVLPQWDIALRGGYWHSQTPVPDQSFSPTIPDADQHAISAGVGLLCKGNGRILGVLNCGSSSESASWVKGIGVDLAYQIILYETRTISGNANPVAVPGVVNGRYETTYHVGGVNLRVLF